MLTYMMSLACCVCLASFEHTTICAACFGQRAWTDDNCSVNEKGGSTLVPVAAGPKPDSSTLWSAHQVMEGLMNTH